MGLGLGLGAMGWAKPSTPRHTVGERAGSHLLTSIATLFMRAVAHWSWSWYSRGLRTMYGRSCVKKEPREGAPERRPYCCTIQRATASRSAR